MSEITVTVGDLAVVVEVPQHEVLVGAVGGVVTSGPETNPIGGTDYGLDSHADENASAFGLEAAATGSESVAVGYQASASEPAGVAVGVRTLAGNRAVALGGDAHAEDFGIALGAYTQAQYSGAVAIGTDSTMAGAVASTSDQIVLGTTRHTTLAPGEIRSNTGFYTVGYVYVGSGLQVNGSATLSADPNTAMQAATKQYADRKWTKWVGSQAEYDAVAVKDPATLYVIV